MKYNKQAKNLIAKKVTTSLTNKKGLLQINFYEFLNEKDHSNTKGLGWFHAPNNIKIVSEGVAVPVRFGWWFGWSLWWLSK